MDNLYEDSSVIFLGEYPAVHMPCHCKANGDGLVYIHQLVAEKILGRCLRENECVHHIDGDKNNYNENNLMIFASIGDHTRYHNALRYKSNYCLYMKDGVYHCIVGDVFIEQIENIYMRMNNINVQMRSLCPICGELKAKHATMCVTCYKNNKASNIPSKDELWKCILSLKNFRAVARKYGVTDNAVRKWCKKYGLLHKTSELKLLINNNDVTKS